MPKFSLEQIKKLPHSELSKVIDRLRQSLKNNKVVQEKFEEYQVPLSELDLVPIKFADLDVSARTEHGIIYLNWQLLLDGQLSKLDHYLVHELTHYLQQTTGDQPTKGSADDDYLDNEFEQEGFQAQTEYLSDTRDDETAERYIKKVLDHHAVPAQERPEKEKDLLRLAGKSEQLTLDLTPKPEQSRSELLQEIKDFVNNFEEKITTIPVKPSRHIRKEKLPPWEQSYRMKKLQELLEVLPQKKE